MFSLSANAYLAAVMTTSQSAIKDVCGKALVLDSEAHEWQHVSSYSIERLIHVGRCAMGACSHVAPSPMDIAVPTAYAHGSTSYTTLFTSRNVVPARKEWDKALEGDCGASQHTPQLNICSHSTVYNGEYNSCTASLFMKSEATTFRESMSTKSITQRSSRKRTCTSSIKSSAKSHPKRQKFSPPRLTLYLCLRSCFSAEKSLRGEGDNLFVATRRTPRTSNSRREKVNESREGRIRYLMEDDAVFLFSENFACCNLGCGIIIKMDGRSDFYYKNGWIKHKEKCTGGIHPIMIVPKEKKQVDNALLKETKIPSDPIHIHGVKSCDDQEEPCRMFSCTNFSILNLRFKF